MENSWATMSDLMKRVTMFKLLEYSFRYWNVTKMLIFVLSQFVKSFVLEFEPGMNQQLMFSVYDIDSRYVFYIKQKT